MHMQEALSAGWPPMVTLTEPGVQGAEVMGTHGWGVSTPMAAAVAAATCGLLGDMHMPNDAMLTIGTMSWMLAAGLESPSTMFTGRTERLPGAFPIEQAIIAPLTTSFGIGSSWPGV